MRAELANACPCDIRSAWDEDRLIGRVIARGFVFDDAIDRIGWAMGRVGDHAVMSVEIEAAALWKKGGFLWRGRMRGADPCSFSSTGELSNGGIFARTRQRIAEHLDLDQAVASRFVDKVRARLPLGNDR
ncbi:hypothetical protein AQ759_25660 [Burkholderia pseudomallei]|nr:hypothetical protein AQ759_25660 [Burkholderia pseudomallei]ONB59192.1 hypothetical protein AQ902_29180 [Burkholderia pseudomallei]